MDVEKLVENANRIDVEILTSKRRHIELIFKSTSKLLILCKPKVYSSKNHKNYNT